MNRALGLAAIALLGSITIVGALYPGAAHARAVLGATHPDGVALYGKHCASCHGRDGKGIPSFRAEGEPDFTDPGFQRSRSDQQLAAAIANGKGSVMPGFKDNLSDAEVGAMVGRVRAFGRKKAK